MHLAQQGQGGVQCSTSWGEERGNTKWRYGRKNSNQQLRSNGIAEDRAEDRARGRASKRGQARGTPMSKKGWKAGQEAEQGGRQVSKQNKVEGMARSKQHGGHSPVQGRSQMWRAQWMMMIGVLGHVNFSGYLRPEGTVE